MAKIMISSATINRKYTWLIFGVLVAISLVAGWMAFYATRWGAWAISDSAVYLKAGENIASGKGYGIVMPNGSYLALTRSGPVFPVLVSLFYLLHIDPITGVRWLDILFFCLTVLASGWLFLQYSSAPWLSIPVALFIAVFPVMLINETGIMTEPAFLIFSILSIFFLLEFFRSDTRLSLILSALCASLVILNRYPGLFLPAVSLTGLLIFTQGTRKNRIRGALIYSLIVFIPVLLWIGWTLLQPASEAQLGLPHPAGIWDYLRNLRVDLFTTIWYWLPFTTGKALPSTRIVKLLFILVPIFLLVLAFFPLWKLYGGKIRRWLADPDVKILWVAGFGAIAYLAIFILSYLFSRTPPDVNDRTLLPLYPLLVIAVFALLSNLIKSLKQGFLYPVGLAVVILLSCVALASYFPQTIQVVSERHQVGAGYTSPGWMNSATIQGVKSIPPDQLMISNDTGAILFFTGRMALEVSERFAPKSVDQFTRYGDDQQDSSQLAFKEHRATLVLFNPGFYWQMHDAYGEQTDQRLSSFYEGLTIVGRYADGAIYRYP
jgi:hypothetical protein